MSSPHPSLTSFPIEKSRSSAMVGRGSHRWGLVNRNGMDQRESSGADGTPKRRRSRRRISSSPQTPALVLSVLQGLTLRQVPPPVAASHHHTSQMLGGAGSLLIFLLLHSNLFQVVT